MNDGWYEDICQKVREFVSQRGKQQKVPIAEISQGLGIPEEDIYLAFSNKAVHGDLVGMNLLVTFGD